MKVFNDGSNYFIMNDDMDPKDSLPAGVFRIGFSRARGYFLIKDELPAITEKIYGIIPAKSEKVLQSFKLATRNLGVILSGEKGIGKTMFAKLLSDKAVAAGYPVIVVDSPMAGIAEFIQNITQECVVLFDEFEKTFRKTSDGDNDPQVELLTLFDGLYKGKKLFVVTCNETRGLNDFFVNRPGRFHYHFRFTTPTRDEVREYLTDNLNDCADETINKIVDFSEKAGLSYDSLRAVVTELNNGYDLEETFADLNITKLETPTYTAIVVFGPGLYAKTEFTGDLTGSENVRFFTSFVFKNGIRGSISLSFDPITAVWNPDDLGYVVPEQDIEITDYGMTDSNAVDEDGNRGRYFDMDDDGLENIPIKPQKLILKRNRGTDIHYAF